MAFASIIEMEIADMSVSCVLGKDIKRDTSTIMWQTGGGANTT